MKNTTCEYTDRSFITILNIGIRADYADDDYIRELLYWVHPHISAAHDVRYTEEEKLTMLRLPRKECQQFYTLNSVLKLY
jgi:hypothetical protein